MTQFYNALLDDFESVGAFILYISPPPPEDVALSKLIDEETRKVSMNITSDKFVPIVQPENQSGILPTTKLYGKLLRNFFFAITVNENI